MSILQTIRYSLLTFNLGKVPSWHPDHVSRLQDLRLRQLLRKVVQRSAFFQEKYRAIDVDGCRLQDLPISNKAEMMGNFDRIVTDPRVSRAGAERFMDDPANLGQYFLGRYGVWHTSGSQGQPLLIVQDRAAIEILFAVIASRGGAFSKPGLIEGMRRLCSPARIAVVTLKRGFFPSGASFEFMPRIAGPFVRILRLSSMQSDLIDQLNQFQPHAIVGYASVLESLEHQAHRLKLSHLRQMSNTSEQLSDQARARILQTFGVPVVNHYATGECLFLSEGCSTDPGAHVNADWAILEVVDEQYRPVPAGQLGKKVLITNLANVVQPFIRYEVGDMVMMTDKPCRCGSRLPRIERIEGRTSDMFWITMAGENRSLTNAFFQSTADALRVVREWQAVQLERNRIELVLELLPGVGIDQETAERRALENLRQIGLPAEVQVSVRLVASLGPDPVTGKFRRMMSRVAA